MLLIDEIEVVGLIPCDTCTDDKLCEEFSWVMTNRFEISMMCELKFFLGFQVKQLKERIFMCQTKYTRHVKEVWHEKGEAYQDYNGFK